MFAASATIPYARKRQAAGCRHHRARARNTIAQSRGQVHHRPAALVDGNSRPDLLSLLEFRQEGVSHGLEAGIAVADQEWQ